MLTRASCNWICLSQCCPLALALTVSAWHTAYLLLEHTRSLSRRVDGVDPESLMQRSYRQFQMERALPSLEARVTKLEVSPSSCKFAVAAHAGVYWWVDELGCSSRWSGRCRAWGHASQSWRGGIGALALCHPASRPCALSACTSCTHVRDNEQLHGWLRQLC